MKITYLKLDNFSYIESGLKRSSVELDLSSSVHPINVFTGKIGSCKTFILGHLQPFATLGSLDIRNQDDPILEGKDGLKIIKYDLDGDEIIITHNYIWANKAGNHSTKSFIEKNGEELNPTGNVSSFKYIVQSEFGLDQSYLRLIRLGENVTGLLHLSATERKTYVASMLESANIILALHKKLKEELRDYNAKISILSNKLIQLEVSKEEQYEQELEYANIEIKKLDSEIKDYEERIIKHQTEISLIAPNGFDDFIEELKKLVNEYDDFRNERNSLEEKIMSLKGNYTIEELSKCIGALESNLSKSRQEIGAFENEYRELEKTRKSLNSKLLQMQNDNHRKILQETYDTLKAQLEDEWERVRDFNCEYSASYLKNLISDLHNVDLLISDISQYDTEIINRCYKSDATIIKWSKDRGEMLTGRRVNISKRINNINFSKSYVIQGVMYTPPFCPTKNCPYKKTHPFTLVGDKSKKEVNSELEDLQAEIASIDKELYLCAEYPIVYTKIANLKEKFKDVSLVLKKLGCLKTETLLLILTRIDKQKWYYYDRLVSIQELCIAKESYYESLNRFREVDKELSDYDVESIEHVTLSRDTCDSNMNNILNIISKYNTECKEMESELARLYGIYNGLLEQAQNEQELLRMNMELEKKFHVIEVMSKQADTISPYAMLISNYKDTVDKLVSLRNTHLDERNALNVKLNDIRFTKQELDDELLFQKYLSYMVDATSSKEGIPLEMINDFVVGCKDIVNELVFDIFEEDIMLEEFEIDEKEFYVPYSIDGKVIKDVTKASQGQRSLFSIAIAFAFSENLDIKYNIPLLDEVDAPLHKNEHMKFLSMVLKHMRRRNSEQLFLITHNSALENIPVNYICTTPEDINLSNGSTIINLYE